MHVSSHACVYRGQCQDQNEKVMIVQQALFAAHPSVQQPLGNKVLITVAVVLCYAGQEGCSRSETCSDLTELEHKVAG